VTHPQPDAESLRLAEDRQRGRNWKRWGPYLSERQWGTVREDYSPDGSAWTYFPHDHARSRAYRWGEDGLAGLCDRHQYICFALALWNGRDPILKERLFGLAGPEGNHGEDVKEYYFYLDSTPTHSYMRYLYKYPQAEYPYRRLVEENARRSKREFEFELIDTGVFDEGRYFDVFVTYAKASPDDILARIDVVNRGPEAAPLHVLPTIWFRNTWSAGFDARKPRMRGAPLRGGASFVEVLHPHYGVRGLFCDGDGGAPPPLLFTENETNNRRIFGSANETPWLKDGINDAVLHGVTEAVNPGAYGTKAAAHYTLDVPAGGAVSLKLRFTEDQNMAEPFGPDFDRVFEDRKSEADAFYAGILPKDVSKDARDVMRQAFGGLLWGKQFYHYDVDRWLKGDHDGPPPPRERLSGRNHEWRHLFNADVMSMPDK
jgi:hypothetical protein